MSPLPYNHANEDNIIEPEVLVAPLDPPENVPSMHYKPIFYNYSPQRTKQLSSRFKDAKMCKQ